MRKAGVGAPSVTRSLGRGGLRRRRRRRPEHVVPWPRSSRWIMRWAARCGAARREFVPCDSTAVLSVLRRRSQSSRAARNDGPPRLATDHRSADTSAVTSAVVPASTAPDDVRTGPSGKRRSPGACEHGHSALVSRRRRTIRAINRGNDDNGKEKRRARRSAVGFEYLRVT